MTEITGRPQTFDHLSSLRRPRRKSVSILLDDAFADELDDARARLDAAKDDAEREGLQACVDQAEAAVRDATVEFTFVSIGRKAYDRLIAEAPPTSKQNDEARKIAGQDAEFNVDKFCPALIAASCESPKLTLEEATRIYDEWVSGEIMTLFFTAMEVNTQRRIVESGKGSGPATG